MSSGAWGLVSEPRLLCRGWGGVGVPGGLSVATLLHLWETSSHLRLAPAGPGPEPSSAGCTAGGDTSPLSTVVPMTVVPCVKGLSWETIQYPLRSSACNCRTFRLIFLFFP